MVMPFQKALKEHCGTYAQIYGYQALVAGSCQKALMPTTSAKQYWADCTRASFDVFRASISKAIELGPPW
eukprot:3283300-Lingulodinium_polyedra.AAC.1